jgi:hypothetical protein
MSPGELENLEIAKGKLACLLGECGYAEAARECELRRQSTTPARGTSQADVEAIVQAVLGKIKK